MKLVGLTGRARSGKDSLAHFLVEQHGFKRVAFADPIRHAVAEITGLSVDELMDGPAKETPLDWLDGVTPRRMMQTLGTEWGRDTIHRDLWLRVAQRKIDAALAAGAPGVVVSDVRFDNEAYFVADQDGLVVEVIREGIAKVEGHASEAGVDPELIDAWVPNNGTLEDLARMAHAVADAEVAK